MGAYFLSRTMFAVLFERCLRTNINITSIFYKTHLILFLCLCGILTGCLDVPLEQQGDAIRAEYERRQSIWSRLWGRDIGEATQLQEVTTSLSTGNETQTTCERIITADVVAIDQIYVFNRFGAYNPFGMMYALRDDVVALDGGNSPGPGNARLRDGKRPRPLVLRANEGDCLNINFENWLSPQPVRAPINGNPAYRVDRGPGNGPQEDTPKTRSASIYINGLPFVDANAKGSYVGLNSSGLVAPGDSTTYMVYAPKEGTHLMYSRGAVTGGQGLGSTTALGLFGAVNIQPRGAKWYRSQVTHEQLQASIKRDQNEQEIRNPDGTPQINYEAKQNGRPILAMLDDNNRIVHSDLTAIISGYDPQTKTPVNRDDGAFREMTIIFHDEVKSVQAFEELEEGHGIHAIQDGAGINYGVAGLGAILYANRKGIGPTADCKNCIFEDFFMSSWPNGDPALNIRVDEDGNAIEALWPDDPSNVYHSYLRDPVRFRNLHAGPKETHVFHLHGHQWLRSPDNDKSNYVDSQTIGPGEGFTYEIAYGGSGNRNLSPGDSIFHCHLYPHFTSGMWALWRTHDVFCDGSTSRNLPDGEIAQGTPTPALVPLPTRAIPPIPTYEPTTVEVNGQDEIRPAMPGYPFYIAGISGKRTAQPPKDIGIDGGLGRHIITSVPDDGVMYGMNTPFDVHITKANLKLLPSEGTPDEQNAMAYHAGEFPGAIAATTQYGFPAKAYPAYRPDGTPDLWYVNGQPPRPGAPFAAPCPPDAPKRYYRLVSMQRNMITNNQGWYDPQGHVYVLEEDFQAAQSGTYPVEPLIIRAESGECIEIQMTNLAPAALQEDDYQIYLPAHMTSLHVHLVKFDMGSDGGMNGFNYEDGPMAAGEVQMMIDAANAMGGAFVADGTLEEQGERIILSAQQHPRIADPLAFGAQASSQVWWADPVEDEQGVDRTLGFAFFHDHMAAAGRQNHGLYGGLIVEPKGSKWRDPESGEFFGTRMDGGPTSYRADILTEVPEQSFREYALGIADFALLFDQNGKPVNPPTAEEGPLPHVIGHEDRYAPEVLAAADPGTMLINYRHEPIPLRIGQMNGGQMVQKTGTAGDMANVFRSDIHGDPATPLLRAYRGDRLKIRLYQGSHEEQHVFAVQGHSFLREPDDPDSGYMPSIGIGVSEQFTLDMNIGLSDSGQPDYSDYLYGSFNTDDLWHGMWGILRSYNIKQHDLLPLPDNEEVENLQGLTSVCPEDAPRRHYTVHAITARDNLPDDRLVYNEFFNLYDPDAILFVEESRLQAIKDGSLLPEPLILRAAAGDCIEITLHNDLPEVLPEVLHYNFNPPIVDKFNTNQVRTSTNISLSPQLIAADPQQNMGSNAGHNNIQTIASGETQYLQWYAGQWIRKNGQLEARPVEFGAINLRSMGDVVNHGMHGAIGALIIEPHGAYWQEDRHHAAQATVHYIGPDNQPRSFREFVMVVQDELTFHSAQCGFESLDPLQPNVLLNLADADDAEDSGHKGMNYRTEPLWARLGLPPQTDENDINRFDVSSILSSNIQGDPETPIFRAKVGDEMRLRVVIPSGHPRQHSIMMDGTQWPQNSFQSGTNSTVMGPSSNTLSMSSVGGMAAGSVANLMPNSPAGGPFRIAGDYMIRDYGSTFMYGGTWGLIRVSDDNHTVVEGAGQ